MTTGVCFDLMEMIGKNVAEIRETVTNKSNFTNVIDELNCIMEEADDYVIYNVENSGWDGERINNGEWDYAFWDLLDNL